MNLKNKQRRLFTLLLFLKEGFKLSFTVVFLRGEALQKIIERPTCDYCRVNMKIYILISLIEHLILNLNYFYAKNNFVYLKLNCYLVKITIYNYLFH